MTPRLLSEARTLTESEMAGSRGADGNGVLLPTVGYRNPGATENLRGVEPNTGKQSDPGNSWPLPMQDGSLTAQDEVIAGGDPFGTV